MTVMEKRKLLAGEYGLDIKEVAVIPETGGWLFEMDGDEYLVADLSELKKLAVNGVVIVKTGMVLAY